MLLHMRLVSGATGPSGLNLRSVNGTGPPQHQSFEAAVDRKALQSPASECELCPPKSYCLLSEIEHPGFFPHPTEENLFYACFCREGYKGEDGWRCEPVDECVDHQPCPAEEFGGYCVNTDPDDPQYARYKCGCLHGYEVISSNEHGATECKSLAFPSSFPSIVPTEAEAEEKAEDLFLNVQGVSASSIFDEKITLERVCKEAYQEVDLNECGCRNLTNVNLNGIIIQNSYLSFSDISNSRYLQTDLDISNTTNSTGSQVFQFDLTLYFTFVFRCLQCPASFFAANDASRRLIRGKNFLGDAFSGVSLDLFLTYLVQNVEEDNISSISKESIDATIEPLLNDFDINDFDIDDLELDDSDLEDLGLGDLGLFDCNDECNPDSQICILERCVCKPGYFSASGVGGLCQDIKECSNNEWNDCDANADCIELEGGYECICKTGFLGDGKEGDCNVPTLPPTQEPSPRPSVPPTESQPTSKPTKSPTVSLSPSDVPSDIPSESDIPSNIPSNIPTPPDSSCQAPIQLFGQEFSIGETSIEIEHSSPHPIPTTIGTFLYCLDPISFCFLHGKYEVVSSVNKILPPSNYLGQNYH